jgi:pyrroloquinoline-quinone synthase
MHLLDRLDAARSRWNVLEHPFYRCWSAGELTTGELSFYAAEYRHAVVALAEAAAGAARASEPGAPAELRQHAAEEAAHVELWNGFAAAVGAPDGVEPRPETLECVEAWTAARDALEGFAILYAVEAGQPEVSRTKLEGLVEHYGVEPGPATAYFELHAERDREHAVQSRRLLEERAGDADPDRLVAAAEGAVRGNWTLLDGVEAGFGR